MEHLNLCVFIYVPSLFILLNNVIFKQVLWGCNLPPCLDRIRTTGEPANHCALTLALHDVATRRLEVDAPLVIVDRVVLAASGR